MFPEFIYENYHYDVQSDGLHISFCFRLNDKLVFEPTALISSRTFLHFERLSKATLDSLVFHIGMIELVSYWKAYCSPTVVIRPFNLSEKQLAFWRKLYFNGLGEFFYTNGINASINDFMQFRCEGSQQVTPISQRLFDGSVAASGSHIVPIGGGKDSVVSLELLRTAEHPLPLIMNPRGATVDCVAQAGYTMDEVLVIKRTIHPLLLDLNKQGGLNGHTPFSAMLAFYTLLASAATGCRPNIALSNENSANESTVAGSSVNHQYSKSLEFENDFRDYVREFISPELNYYSFLRPLSELQIAKLFSRYEQYFPVFKSCNVGSKTDVWCGHCAKCLFAYIILSPFIAPERLTAIFGKNMLDDDSLQLEFDQLVGSAETKPFECVGTISEVNAALFLTQHRWYRHFDDRPALLRKWNGSSMGAPQLDTLLPQHNLPADEVDLIRRSLHSASPASACLRYSRLRQCFVNRDILIAGFGREGKSSLELLQQLFPDRSFDIAHNNEEIIEALDNRHYDLILKSPGVPSFVLEGHCDPSVISSQTDIFLQVYGDITIGITGTKGKSTTTSLICQALKNGRRRYPVIAGNIGVPLFDVIPQLDELSVVVAELSCHQLEHIRRGPHIGVILNFFQEHLDHYHSYLDYQEAKMQMALRQREGDVCYYCSDNADLAQAVERHQGSFAGCMCAYGYKGSFDETGNLGALNPLDGMPLKLKGDHNMRNIVAAWKASCDYCDEASFVQTVADFQGLEHRLEYVGEVRNVKYYNDSIATIPQATIEAVEALGLVQTLILGGFNRGIDYQPLVDYLVNQPLGRQVKNIVLFGSAGREIKRLMQSDKVYFCQQVNIFEHFDDDYDMAQAVRFADNNTEPGHVCLLSPAASSYDHYKNFEYRGAHFKDCVKRLAEENMYGTDHFVSLRHQLHAHPDTSSHEQFAHDLVVSELQRLKPTKLFTHVGGYGVIAFFEKNTRSGLNIAFRADTDALPIGHRCGHDGHTAILLHFAQYVATHELKNNVILIFQPEEETGQGARKIVASQILQQLHVNAIYGLHNIPGYPKGSVVVTQGAFAMASTGLVYRLKGRPTHASTPERGINPDLAVAEIIQGIHALNSPASILTLVGCRIGEGAFGTAAGDAEISFTIRSGLGLDNLISDCDDVVKQSAGRYGLQWEKELCESFHVTMPTGCLQSRMVDCFKPHLQIIERDKPFPWSEDFAEYLKTPLSGVFFGLGSGEDQPELHHPDYEFPDDIIETGSRCFQLIAENASQSDFNKY